MKIPSLQSMINLYGYSMELTLEAQNFQGQVEQLKRLALNAEVLAVRSDVQGDVFQTIAKEIGRLSAQVTEVITELIVSIKKVADKTIDSAATARICELYLLAIKKGVEGKTLDDINLHINDIGQEILSDLATIHKSLFDASKTLNDISRLQVQLPMIATILNIEAYRDSNTDSALGANAKYLLVLKDSLSQLLETVIFKTKTTLAFLDQHGLENQ